MDLRFLSYYYSPLKVIDMARLNHENIAKFLDYCRESDPFSRMLVFEYASNGTLYEHRTYTMGKWPNSLGSDE
uniref:Serine-threonine/tyrosine-protein kinase catalytic domain-containing protein n=1 Tax=Aegilops tauschii subsp. strangulata TaxID=200361 RepID=A0A453PI32_AEGTS